jgi:hypothetical protein
MSRNFENRRQASKQLVAVSQFCCAIGPLGCRDQGISLTLLDCAGLHGIGLAGFRALFFPRSYRRAQFPEPRGALVYCVHLPLQV